MKTYKQHYNDLIEQVENRLEKLIEWKGEKSEHVNENCLKIDSYMTDYDEITVLHGRLILIDRDGMQYNLSCIPTAELCNIVDKLSIFNPNDNKNYPLRYLEDLSIDLSDYPNFSKTGSVYGMKKLYYGKGALLVHHGNYIYNVTSTPEIYFEHSEDYENS